MNLDTGHGDKVGVLAVEGFTAQSMWNLLGKEAWLSWRTAGPGIGVQPGPRVPAAGGELGRSLHVSNHLLMKATGGASAGRQP